MSSPLAQATSLLVTAESRRVRAEQAAAARWSDAAYRQVDARVLRKVADESRHFAAAVQLLDSALGRCLDHVRN